jgi:DNA-binding CsgD family transcriptional regulator
VQADDLRLLSELVGQHQLEADQVEDLLARSPRHWEKMLAIPADFLVLLDKMGCPDTSGQQAYRLQQRYDLTAREMETLYLLALGKTYKQMADQMFVAETTVKTHINNLFGKMHVHDKLQAVVIAHAYQYPPASHLLENLQRAA